MAKAKKKPRAKTWLFPLAAAPLIGFALLLGLGAAVLSHGGEYLPMDDAVAHLQSGNGVYAPALSPRLRAFRDKLYEKTAPEIVVLGSARVDQFRADDFSVPFVNLGGAESLDDLVATSRRLFDKQPPKAAILALDDWWFAQGASAIPTPQHPPEAEKPGVHDLLLLAGKLSFTDAKTILAGGTDNIGIDAILTGDGFDRSGAYSYHRLWTGALPSPDRNFAASLDGVAHGSGMFIGGNDIDMAQWQKLTDLLDYLQGKKVDTYILLPPVAPTVLDAMAASGKYGYAEGFRMKISETAAAYHLPLFDDHDLRHAGVTDCEFIDGVHPGAIADKRALLDMAVTDAALRARLKLPELGWAIEHFKGRASTLPDEADFLGIGCQKPAVPALSSSTH